jgi:zinc transport system substrate-binding protein
MRFPALLGVVAALASACTAGAGPTGGRTSVLAAAYPFAWAAQQVGGPDVAVTDLVKSGVEPHDIELSPRQVAAFQSAGVVV